MASTTASISLASGSDSRNESENRAAISDLRTYTSLSVTRRVEALEVRVAVRAEEREGGDEGAGADAGDDVERGRVPDSVQPASTPAE